MDIQENIDRLYQVFNYPRSRLNEKIKAREEIAIELKNLGYDVIIEEHKKRSLRNIGGKNINVSTSCENPKYIISAHYDSPSSINSKWFAYNSRRIDLRFKNYILKLIIIILCNIPRALINALLSLIVLLILKNIGIKNNLLGISALIFTGLSFYPFRVNLFKSVYQADDNTSGIISVLILARILKEKNINNVQFIFFDNEEKGLCGSKGFVRSQMINNAMYNGVKIINLDTIGRGRNITLKYEGKYVNKYFTDKGKKYKINDELKDSFSSISTDKIMEIDKSFSDCKSFIEKGFEAISIIRCDVIRFFGKDVPEISWVHTKADILKNIDPKRMAEIIQAITILISIENRYNTEERTRVEC